MWFEIFLQNVIRNLGFRPLSSKMWSETPFPDPKPRCFQTPFITPITTKPLAETEGVNQAFAIAFSKSMESFQGIWERYMFWEFLKARLMT